MPLRFFSEGIPVIYTYHVSNEREYLSPLNDIDKYMIKGSEMKYSIKNLFITFVL